MSKWHVVKVAAIGGLRVGMVEAEEAKGLEILSPHPLSEEEAINLSKRLSEELGISEFDNGLDEY